MLCDRRGRRRKTAVERRNVDQIRLSESIFEQECGKASPRYPTVPCTPNRGGTPRRNNKIAVKQRLSRKTSIGRHQPMGGAALLAGIPILIKIAATHPPTNHELSDVFFFLTFVIFPFCNHQYISSQLAVGLDFTWSRSPSTVALRHPGCGRRRPHRLPSVAARYSHAEPPLSEGGHSGRGSGSNRV